jgi:hypothetical protein
LSNGILGSEFTVSIEIVQGQTAQGQAQEGTQVIIRCQPSEQATRYQWTFASNAVRSLQSTCLLIYEMSLI